MILGNKKLKKLLAEVRVGHRNILAHAELKYILEYADGEIDHLKKELYRAKFELTKLKLKTRD